MSASAHKTPGDGQTQALIRRTPATIGSGAQLNIQPPHGFGDLIGAGPWPELPVNRFFLASQCGDQSGFGAFLFTGSHQRLKGLLFNLEKKKQTNIEMSAEKKLYYEAAFV